MKILHASDSYLPTIGGIELHIRDRMAHQQANGDEPHLVTPTPTQGNDPVHVHRVRPSGSGSGAPKPVRKSIEEVLQAVRPDVVHVHASIVSPFAWQTARAATTLGIPTLVTVHSMWSGPGPMSQAIGHGLGLNRLPVVWSAVSERAAEGVAGIVGRVQPVHVLPNAVAPDQWRPVALPSSDEPLTVLAVMRLTHLKRTMPLLRMLAQLPASAPGARAVVIGDGPQYQAASAFVSRHGLQDVVSLPGRLDRIEIRRHLERASVFIAPAERESFGIAALEARAMGLPVIGHARSGVGEFITDGVDGYLASDDSMMLSRLTQLLNDPAERRRIEQHNRSVPIRHDWSHTTELAHSLYVEAEMVARGHAIAPSRLRTLLPVRVPLRQQVMAR